MKMQKLVKICKNERALLLYDTADGVQWLGNRTAMFPLYSHPKYAEENIFAALDINEKQREKSRSSTTPQRRHILMFRISWIRNLSWNERAGLQSIIAANI